MPDPRNPSHAASLAAWRARQVRRSPSWGGVLLVLGAVTGASGPASALALSNGRNTVICATVCAWQFLVGLILGALGLLIHQRYVAADPRPREEA